MNLRGKWCNALALVLVFLAPAAAAAVEYSPIDISSVCNTPMIQIYYGGFPTGNLTLGGVPFEIPSGNNAWWSGVTANYTPASISVPINIYGATEVDTLINTGWGMTGGPGDGGAWTYLEFFGSDGAYYRKDLWGNDDIRGWQYDSDAWTLNYINNTTTVNVWENGSRHVDKQLITLPADFADETLESMTMTDRGAQDAGPWASHRAYLEGLTVGAPTPDIYNFRFDYDGGQGDYYTGYFYANPDQGYDLTYTQEVTDENGDLGLYTITGVQEEAGDSTKAGQVYVTNYYDHESLNSFTPVSNGTAVGSNYLGSENDYIISNAIETYRFGSGYEADLSSYFVYDQWGGNWHDANKTWIDDNYLCWAAASANILDWGYWSTKDFSNETSILQTFADHWSDNGQFENYAWQWWIDGTEPLPSDIGSYVDVQGAGGYWSGYNFENYFAQSPLENLLGAIDDYFEAGYGVTFNVMDSENGNHALTAWGFDYYDNPQTNYRTYKGIYFTDSDDNTTQLQHDLVSWSTLNNWWELNGNYSGWHIYDVEALKINPTPVATYQFTYNYGNGDWYSGYVYAQNGEYTLNDTIAQTDENSLDGYYTITDVSYSSDETKYGQVFVTSYYDKESGNTYTPLSNGTAVGTAYLGSEADYIIMAGVTEYLFGSCGETFYEADLTAYAYAYKFTYGDGDYYTGTVYAAPEYGYGMDYPESPGNDIGNNGVYEFTDVTTGQDATRKGQVFVTSYYDHESDSTYTPVSNGIAVYTNYLGGEHDYIILAGIPEYLFGWSGDSLYEADLVAYAYNFQFTYGDGDYYTGTVYAAPENGYSLGYSKTVTDENGQTGTYTITSFSNGIASIPYQQITGHIDADNEYSWDYSYNIGFGLADDLNVPKLHVEIDIYLTGDDPGAALRDLWEKGIQYLWGDQYFITNGAESYPLEFTVDWVTDANAADQTVTVYDSSGWTNMSEWYTELGGDDYSWHPQVTAHEFGHMLGLYDEYLNGATHNGVTYTDALMGDLGAVQERYYTGFLTWLQSQTGINSLSLTAATGTEPAYDVSLAGLVFVNSYYDHESGNTYTPVSNGTAVGTAYLGSEADYIIMAGVTEYLFGICEETFYEADLAAYAYAYKFTYGNGDYYTGTVYAEPEKGYSTSYTQSVTDENSQAGTYTITGVSTGYDVSKAGQVYVSSYYDKESGNTYTPVSSSTAMGSNYLASEVGYIIWQDIPEFKFGKGAGATFYEADVGSYSRYDFLYYYSRWGSDYYTGYVYAPTSFQTSVPFINYATYIYYQPMELWASGYYSFNGGFYYILSITDGFASSYDKKCYVTAYNDGDTAHASLGVNSDGSPTAGSISVANRTLGWETGYAISGSNHALFSPYTRADFSGAGGMAGGTSIQAVWTAYWSKSDSLLEEENDR